jgi:hypothetical protein
MIATLIIVALFFAWLLIETKFLTIHLLVGKIPPAKEVIHLKEITPIKPIVSNTKPLLLEQNCSLTKLHNEFNRRMK